MNPRDKPETPRNLRGIPQVNWSALQTVFLHECESPIFFVLDCCYAGASVHRESSTGTVVALAATGFHDVAPVRGKDSFTTFLTKALKSERDKGRTVHVPYLKTLISAMLNNPDMLDVRGTSRRVTPDYFPFSNGTIALKVLPARLYDREQFDAPNAEQMTQLAMVETVHALENPVRPATPRRRNMSPKLMFPRSNSTPTNEILTLLDMSPKTPQTDPFPADPFPAEGRRRDAAGRSPSSKLLGGSPPPDPPDRPPTPELISSTKRPPSTGKYRTPTNRYKFIF